MALLHRSRRSGSLPAAVPTRLAVGSSRMPARRPVPVPGPPAGTGTRPLGLDASRPVPGAGQDGTVMRGVGGSQPAAGGRGAGALPPSVARVATRIRLSAELLAAILEVEERTWATLDDMERADALADRLLARRRDRLTATADAGLAGVAGRTPGGAPVRLSA